MDPHVEQNKQAWEFDAYNFWINQVGTPAEQAAAVLRDPRAMLGRFARYFPDVLGLKITNICGSCGKRALPLAALGAAVTVFDLSEANRRYAVETAAAAGLSIECEMAHARFYDEAKRRLIPKCFIHRHMLSEIINNVIGSGFFLQQFDELPAWYKRHLPGEFVLVANASRASAR